MKTKILELLKTKFPGVQDSVLNRIAENLAKTALTEEQATTSVEGVTIQTVIDRFADSRANEAQNTAVANYEKKHGIKDGKSSTEPQPNPGGDPNDIATIIANALKPLQDKISAFENGQTTNTRRSTLAAKLSDAKAPEAFTNQTLKFVDKMNLSDEEFEAYTTDVLASAATIVQENTNSLLGSQHQPFSSLAGEAGKTIIENDIKSWADSKNPGASK